MISTLRPLMATAIMYFGVLRVGAVESASDTGLNLIPWPAQVTPRPGLFTLTPKTQIVADPGFSKEAEQLAKMAEVEEGTVA